MEISCLLDAASEETLRLYQIGLDDTAAEEAFEHAMNQLRMVTMRATTIERMGATASAVLHFEWDANVEFTEEAIEGAAFGVLVAGLLDKAASGSSATGPRPGSESTKIGPPAVNRHGRSGLGINCP
ncbi:hypothetical protein ACQPTN_05885 [Bradyrhizobium sp. 13971]